MEKWLPETQVIDVCGDNLGGMIRAVIDRGFSVSGGSCPSCGSSDLSRYGKTAAGTQRWKCQICGSVRTAIRTGRILANTKLDYSTWVAFIPLFIERASCDKVAEVLGVCHKTAWFMRVRMLEAVFEELPTFSADVDFQVGRMYFRESYKGTTKTGKSDERIGVVVAENKVGDFLYDVSCRGKVTLGNAGSSFLNRLRSGAVSCEGSVSRMMKVIPGSFKMTDCVSATVSRIRKFMAPFHGVSTKWLSMYLGWFKWSGCFGSSMVAGLSHMAGGDYVHTWTGIHGMKVPFAEA